MKKFLSFLRIFTIFCALFIFIVTLVGVYGFLSGNTSIPVFILFMVVVLFITGGLVFINVFYSKFAYSVGLNNEEIVFNFKNNQIGFNREECVRIWTNSYITKFVFKDKVLWCFDKHFSPSNGAEKLADIINAEYFENAVIKRIWS